MKLKRDGNPRSYLIKSCFDRDDDADADDNDDDADYSHNDGRSNGLFIMSH